MARSCTCLHCDKRQIQLQIFFFVVDIDDKDAETSRNASRRYTSIHLKINVAVFQCGFKGLPIDVLGAQLILSLVVDSLVQYYSIESIFCECLVLVGMSVIESTQ